MEDVQVAELPAADGAEVNPLCGTSDADQQETAAAVALDALEVVFDQLREQDAIESKPFGGTGCPAAI